MLGSVARAKVGHPAITAAVAGGCNPQLYQALANYCTVAIYDEADTGDMKKSQLLWSFAKTITGGDDLSTRTLYSGCRTFLPTMKWHWLTNERLAIPADSWSIARRLHVWGWDVKFVCPEDPVEKTKLVPADVAAGVQIHSTQHTRPSAVHFAP